MKTEEYITFIGLEVHVELKTKSKMFCGCSASYFGHEPNTHCCPVCLGLPGTLPVPNRKAVEWCVMLGLALNCQIPEVSKFDRKNYFYPDLPKGYQISQYDMPLCVSGNLRIRDKSVILGSEATPESKTDSGQARMTKEKEIRIKRVHMEEDTAKLVHQTETQNNVNYTLIDFNRSGVPLVEIVTEPDIHSSQEAKIFLHKLQQIIRYLGISDCDMEKGSMRCEPNISIKKFTPGESLRNTPGVAGTDSPGVNGLPNYKVEIKNINSFKFVEKAIEYEIGRQIELLSRGETVRQETRGFNPQKGITLPQRGKEEAADYRYFPEPDIPAIRWTKEQILNIKSKICELPDAKLLRFIKDYGLGDYDAGILTTSLATADYYEKCIKYIAKRSPGRSPFGHLPGGAKQLLEGVKVVSKTVANWIINKRVDIEKVSPAQLVQMILQKTQASTISNEELEKIIKKILVENPKASNDYKLGKQQALMFLVGQVMREAREQAKPEEIKEKLRDHIKRAPQV